jgi:hypothetical protein
MDNIVDGFKEKYGGKVDDKYYNDAEKEIDDKVRKNIRKNIKDRINEILYSSERYRVKTVELQALLHDLEFIQYKLSVTYNGGVNLIYTKEPFDKEKIKEKYIEAHKKMRQRKANYEQPK